LPAADKLEMDPEPRRLPIRFETPEAFAVTLFRLVTGAQTSTGRVTGAVVFAAVMVFLTVGWIRISRTPRRRLEITEDAIRYVQPGGGVSVLSRQSGDELAFVMQHRGAMSRVWVLGLTIKGTDTVMDLRGEFPREEVRQACLARGWRFDRQRRNWRGMLPRCITREKLQLLIAPESLFCHRAPCQAVNMPLLDRAS